MGEGAAGCGGAGASVRQGRGRAVARNQSVSRSVTTGSAADNDAAEWPGSRRADAGRGGRPGGGGAERESVRRLGKGRLQGAGEDIPAGGGVFGEGEPAAVWGDEDAGDAGEGQKGCCHRVVGGGGGRSVTAWTTVQAGWRGERRINREASG